ncbi:radical SAM protein [Polyangium aurulentum]|uniref:radical SAM protein n=1 Tax=Polyangium aurulentum TaxID=2567896 RepID=UPI00200CB442|nr:radical SAM protein [Polyangium aurulentum]UQA63050.1 radical SAM protein [Polyangium aurulentum]
MVRAKQAPVPALVPAGGKLPKTVDLPLLGMREGRPIAGPGTVHIDITNGCNTNCITCWDHSPLLDSPRSSAWKRARVETGAVIALLDDVLALGGLEAIILSGMGEPFTHPEVYRMIEAVKARGLHLTIITNLIPADPARILHLGVDQLLIGIHAATERAYRAFHPSFRSDEWTMLLDMLERFAAAGRRFKHVHVICDVNAEELVDMVRLGHRYRAAGINFKLAGLKEGTEGCRITPAQRRLLEGELVPEAQRVAAEFGIETNLDVFSTQLEAGEEATADIAEIGCFMGYAYARVLVDGTVLYCCNTDVRVGSLADGTAFSALWNGPAWNALRERMRRGEYFESCGQCGKLNQNVKLSRRYAARYGEDALREVTGRGRAP